MKEQTLSEAQSINLVRNALLVAGQEMGEEGDHWPVIKSTIYQLMREWEELQIERNVDAELKQHLGEQLALMESRLAECPEDIRAEQARILKEMRDAYDACFSPIDEKQLFVSEEDMPAYLKQAKHIISTLEDENG